MEKEVPEVSDSPDCLVNAGNSCEVCDRNMGMFPIAPICQHCRPKRQENGDVIYAICKRELGGENWKRIPTSTIKIDDENKVNIVKGEHKDITFLNGNPVLSSQGPNTFLINDNTLTMYWAVFSKEVMGNNETE